MARIKDFEQRMQEAAEEMEEEAEGEGTGLRTHEIMAVCKLLAEAKQAGWSDGVSNVISSR